MAKPDWGMLQQQFLAEHAITGISPKEWCELKELNYATARRYIKISSAQNAQKTAHKKLRTAQKKECARYLMVNSWRIFFIAGAKRSQHQFCFVCGRNHRT